jgi:hypothetical protein
MFFLVFSLPVHAKMYKWVDENGQTHFGDKVPARYLKKEHKELNEQGATIKTHDAAETEEQIAEKRRQERLRKEEEKKAEDQAKRDRVLLDTYTTERDLVAARDARLDAVASQMQLSESIIADAKRKHEATEKQITQIKATGREVPKNISDKMVREEKQLATQQKIAQGHRERQQQIITQFDGYIDRFRELKAEQKRVKEEREARRRKELGLD